MRKASIMAQGLDKQAFSENPEGKRVLKAGTFCVVLQLLLYARRRNGLWQRGRSREIAQVKSSKLTAVITIGTNHSSSEREKCCVTRNPLAYHLGHRIARRLQRHRRRAFLRDRLLWRRRAWPRTGRRSYFGVARQALNCRQRTSRVLS